MAQPFCLLGRIGGLFDSSRICCLGPALYPWVGRENFPTEIVKIAHSPATLRNMFKATRIRKKPKIRFRRLALIRCAKAAP